MDVEENLPGFLMTSEPGSFAQATIIRRKPKIIEEVIANNDYPSFVIKRLKDLKEEILSSKIQPLTKEAPDVARWNKVWEEYRNRTWLELPWYFAESYFYRRLLEAIEYFQPGQLQSRDPFQMLKSKQLMESIRPLSVALDAMERIRDPKLRLENLLHASLWGNRFDLSNLTVTDETRRRQAIIEKENLLINDAHKVLGVFMEKSFSHISFICDNVGMELGFDLFLADFLLRKGWVNKITFYLKPYPFFVSDAMPKDLEETIRVFVEESSPNLSHLGKRMQTAVSEGKLLLSADWFWTSPHHFCEMPKPLHEEISQLDIVILKGDVNYRRLLSDRHWPYTTKVTEIVRYFPTSLLILRTLKGEIIVGLEEGQSEKIEVQDPDWLINGKRGIIQYVERNSP